MRKLLQQSSILLVLIFLLETFFRAYIISPSQINSWGFNPNGYGDLLPNRNFIADELPALPYRVITNSQGLRNEKNYAIPKPPGTYRILAIGDSFTFGPYVNQQDTYPAKLEQGLKDNNIKVEVINAGVSGYTLVDELSYLQQKGIKLQPDLVILGVYQNDVSDYQPEKLAVTSRKSHQLISPAINAIYNIAKKSAILTAGEKYLANIQVQKYRQKLAANPTNLDKELTAYFSDLEKLTAFLKQTQTPTVFVLFPNFDQVAGQSYEPQQRIREKLNEYRVIDLLPVFQAAPDIKSLFLLPENGHLSVYGNLITAKTLVSQISPNKLQ